MGREILIKTKKQVNELQERVFVNDPPVEKDEEDEDQEASFRNVSVRVDASDDANMQYESGADTVYGQGSNPKPEDETYLSLLKGTSPVKAKVKIKEKDDEKEKIKVGVYRGPTEPNPDLKPAWYGSEK